MPPIKTWQSRTEKNFLLVLLFLLCAEFANSQELQPNLLPPGAVEQDAPQRGQYYQPGFQYDARGERSEIVSGANTRYQLPQSSSSVGNSVQPNSIAPTHSTLPTTYPSSSRYGVPDANRGPLATGPSASAQSAASPGSQLPYARQAMRQPPTQVTSSPVTQQQYSQQPVSSNASHLKVANSYRVSADGESQRIADSKSGHSQTTPAPANPPNYGSEQNVSNPIRQYNNPYRNGPVENNRYASPSRTDQQDATIGSNRQDNSPPPRISSQAPGEAKAASPQIEQQATSDNNPAEETASQTVKETNPNTSSQQPPSQPVSPAVEQKSSESDSELASLTARVTQRTEELQAAADIEEQLKTDALAVLKSAKEWLTRAAQWEKKQAEYQAETTAVPDNITQTKELLAKEVITLAPELPADAGLIQMEQILSETEAALKKHRQSLTEQEGEVKQRAERKAAMAKQLEQVEARLAEIQKAIASGTSDGMSPQLSQAQLLELAARDYSSKAERKLLQAEAARHEAVVELLPLRRDLALKLVKEHEALVATWQANVADYRKRESERQAREARERVSAAHPALKALAERNAELAERRTELAEKIEAVQGELEWIQSSLAEIDEQHKSITEKVKVVGLSSTVGLLLRKQRGELPRLDYHHARLQEIEEELPQIQLASLELEEEREAIGDLDGAVQAVVKDLGGTATQLPPEELQQIVKQFLETKKQYLNDLHNDNDAYQDVLGELDIITRRLTTKTTEFCNYVDKHVLWIRSTEPVSATDFKQSWSAIQAILSPASFADVAQAVKQSLQNRPFQWLAMIFGFLFLRLAATRIRQKLEAGRTVKSEQQKNNFLPILASLGLTLFNAMMWPALTWLIGWQLAAVQNEQEIVNALSTGLMITSVLCIALEISRQACMPGGLADEYLDWPEDKLQLLRQKIRWLMWLGLPAVFGVVVLEQVQSGEWADSAGRLLFISGMGLLAILSHGLLRPGAGLWNRTDESAKPSLVQRLRYLWYAIGMIAPLGLAWLATTGYYYSARELAVRMKMSFWLLIATVLAASLVTRLLYVVAQGVNRHKKFVRRDRASKQEPRVTQIAVADLDEMEEAEETTDAPSIETVETTLPAAGEEEHLDLVNIRGQVARLIQGVALVCFVLVSYNIWAEVLPAFRVLDKVELWSSVQDVTDTVTDPDGNVTTTIVKRPVPTTLSHLLVALAVFQITLLAAKNLPGFLEIAVLNRLPIDRGGRYAVSVICRYSLTVAGFMMGFQMLGLTWSSVQWLIAAMTVGLGFGLQEIFANFVSGMIILFERPVRVGDLVTIGGQTGHVSRVQIRATTITDFDRRELIIPNKNFITGELINWTLSDPITRVVIPIGVAYGSDVDLTQRTLLNVSKTHAMVLNEPAPSAMFTSFGDSTLNFELRFYLGSRENYGQVLHELNSAIDKAFREAKIEIAFPQQEVTIKSVAAFAPFMKQTEIAGHAATEDSSGIQKAA